MTIEEGIEVYDVELTDVDRPARRVTFAAGEDLWVCSTPYPDLWNVGMIGRLTLRPDGTFSFCAYPDPRLRRDPSADQRPSGRWGWRLGDHRFCVKAHITPGANGAVVSEDVTELRLDLPREFRELCEEYGVTPRAALRSFVADVCSLQNLLALPREDGYSSNGSDERLFASQYWERTHQYSRAEHKPAATVN